MTIDLLIGMFFLVGGLFCIFKPEVYYQKDKLNPSQIARNNLILKRCGAGLVALSVGLIVLTLLPD